MFQENNYHPDYQKNSHYTFVNDYKLLSKEILENDGDSLNSGEDYFDVLLNLNCSLDDSFQKDCLKLMKSSHIYADEYINEESLMKLFHLDFASECYGKEAFQNDHWMDNLIEINERIEYLLYTKIGFESRLDYFIEKFHFCDYAKRVLTEIFETNKRMDRQMNVRKIRWFELWKGIS